MHFLPPVVGIRFLRPRLMVLKPIHSESSSWQQIGRPLGPSNSVSPEKKQSFQKNKLTKQQLEGQQKKRDPPKKNLKEFFSLLRSIAVFLDPLGPSPVKKSTITQRAARQGHKRTPTHTISVRLRLDLLPHRYRRRLGRLVGRKAQLQRLARAAEWRRQHLRDVRQPAKPRSV